MRDTTHEHFFSAALRCEASEIRDNLLTDIAGGNGQDSPIGVRTLSRCASRGHDATGLWDHEEIALHTGLAHGFIYRPLREWVEPATRWAESAHSGR